jgi:hypothetical protein
MKTRVVLMLDELEFARLAGSASGAGLQLQEFIKRELNLIKPTHRMPDATPTLDVTMKEPTLRPFKHVHNWCPTDSDLIDRCSVCGEERALPS